jgi:RNA polymerase sigma factor (sigma-70 family)
MCDVMTSDAVEFPPTRISLINEAQDGTGGGRHAALDHLCRRYWHPVYCFVRRAWSKSVEDAQDLTQAFFLRLIEQDVLATYVPARGSFRQFLKSVLRHVAADQHDAEKALKRGGGARRISIHGDDGEDRLDAGIEDLRAREPESAFDASWRREALARAAARARAWFASRGRAAKFEVFEASLAGDAERPTYAAIAARFGLTESAVRNALFEVRERIRAEARAEIAQTAHAARQVDDEYRDLIGR